MIAATSVEKLIEEHGPMTRAEAHRVLVRNFDAANLSVKEISRRIGITPDRVEQILDQLDGMPHEDAAARAPSVEPLPGKVIRADVMPLPTKSAAPAPVKRSPEQVKPAGRPAAKSWSRKPAACGTPQAIIRHRRRHEPLCDACAAADPIKCGTTPGYKRHYRLNEKPCDPCREAYNAEERAKTASNGGTRKKLEKLAVGGIVPTPGVKVTLAMHDEPELVIPLNTRPTIAMPGVARVLSRREYGLGSPGSIRAVSAEAAKAARNAGAKVYRRTVTEWEQVSP